MLYIWIAIILIFIVLVPPFILKVLNLTDIVVQQVTPIGQLVVGILTVVIPMLRNFYKNKKKPVLEFGKFTKTDSPLEPIYFVRINHSDGEGKAKNFLLAEQKVLETLSLYPKLSFEELVAKSEINTYALEKVLYNHSMKFYPPVLILNNKTFNLHENSIGKKIIQNIWILYNITLLILQRTQKEKLFMNYLYLGLF